MIGLRFFALKIKKNAFSLIPYNIFRLPEKFFQIPVIVKQLQNAKNKNNALCINILQFKFNPVCHYEPSRKAWRGNPVKNRRFFTNATGVVTTRFISNLRLPEMITDTTVTTPCGVDELLRNSLDCHAETLFRLAMTRRIKFRLPEKFFKSPLLKTSIFINPTPNPFIIRTLYFSGCLKQIKEHTL